MFFDETYVPGFCFLKAIAIGSSHTTKGSCRSTVVGCLSNCQLSFQ